MFLKNPKNHLNLMLVPEEPLEPDVPEEPELPPLVPEEPELPLVPEEPDLNLMFLKNHLNH
jgi:hypothetical protein